MALEDMRETGSCRVSLGTPKAQPEPGAVAALIVVALRRLRQENFGKFKLQTNTLSQKRGREWRGAKGVVGREDAGHKVP